MKNRIRAIMALALLCTASTTVHASENATLYRLQGIPGRDYSATAEPEFPVDVLINDEFCNTHGLAYGVISGPLTFAPGTYDIKISVANTLAPCTNSPIVDSSLALGSDKSVSAVLELSSSRTPTLETFTNNFSPVTTNDARISFALAVDSPAVQLILQSTATKKLYTYSVSPGELLDATLPAGNHTAEVNEGTITLVSSIGHALRSQSVTLTFVTGEAANGSVDLVLKTVRNVF